MPNYTLTHNPSIAPDQAHSSASAPTSSLEACTPAETQLSLLSVSLQILDQPLTLLRSGQVGDKEMTRPSSLIPGSSLGRHLRHMHDHFRLLLDALPSSSTRSSTQPLLLNYDVRLRSPLEESASKAIAELESAQQRLREAFAMEEQRGEERSAAAAAEPLVQKKIILKATTPMSVEFESTVGRELWFVCLHAIHHLALMRPILSQELGLKLDAEFGVAPSTLVNRAWNTGRAIASKL
ncbi:DinB-like domain [Ceraceosorus bombacis]|uniref:DinB-like domain n=1 Tax=Ceraceosorus bombacis TaxID=401625 RepID=A0A0P1BGS7_9BASI|nr:DinB-like domain [Ceraceosorus bombacis]